MRRAQEPEEQLPVSAHLQSSLGALTLCMASHLLLSHMGLANISSVYTSAGTEVQAAAMSVPHDRWELGLRLL